MDTDQTWLAAFSAEADGATDGSLVRPYVEGGKGADGKVGVVVEVTRKRSGEWLVVFAAMRPGEDALSYALTAIVAFSDSSARCDRFNRDGLPAFEAGIAHDRRHDRLSVTIEAFGESAGAGAASPQATLATFVIEGLPIAARPDTADDAQPAVRIALHFEQTLASPSPIDPGGRVRVARAGARALGWFQPPAVPAKVRLTVPALRYPDLSPLDAIPHDQTAFHVWRGSWHDRVSRARQPVTGPPVPPHLLPEQARGSQYYVPSSFRFEAVEWLGFRLDPRDTGASPSEIDALMCDLLAGLNAGADGVAALPDRFVAASSTISIDLLRYGRMKLGQPPKGSKLTGKEHFSQHELVLRIAVRRSGDPFGSITAVHVPAIFVDNPWSRYLGREMLGFDKRMMAAYDAEGRLLRDRGSPAAAAAGVPPVALSQVRQLMLRDRPLPLLRRGRTAPLLELQYSIDPDRAAFIEVADDRLLTPSARASFAWRADEVDGRDDGVFATDVRAQRLSGFCGVQSAPVDGRDLPRAIVESRVDFRSVRLAFPDGLVTLSLSRPPGTPPAWRRLWQFLDAHGGAEVTLPAGDWYRMHCDMRLEVIDPLGW